MTKLFLFVLLAVAPLLAGELSSSGETKAFFIRYEGRVAAFGGFPVPAGYDLLIVEASNSAMSGYFEIAVNYRESTRTSPSGVRAEDPEPQAYRIRSLYVRYYGATAYIPVPSWVVVDSISATYLPRAEKTVFPDGGKDSPGLLGQ